MYVDIVFPQKLQPLTYRVPLDAPKNLIGRIVSAPLGNRIAKGIIVFESHECTIKNTKEIIAIHSQVLSADSVSFLLWLSEYYITPAGIALKSFFFDEISSAIDIQTENTYDDKPETTLKTTSKNTETIIKAIKSNSYKTFLFHPISENMEKNLLMETLIAINPDNRGIIILVPEITHLKVMMPILYEIFKKRLCILHGKLTKKKRFATINGIISGETPVVLGTRSAIFAPLKKISLIAVIHEHSPSYKAKEGLRYNARDAAVMRGFLEKSCVLLSSICPSVESVYNAKIGKYHFIAPLPNLCVEKRPKLKIIDIRKNYKDAISPEIIREAKKTIEAKEQALFLINRKGYSLLRCEDCGSVARCEKCNIPVSIFKDKQRLRCRLCGKEKAIPESCAQCKSYKLIFFGAGTERILEELHEVISAKTIAIEKKQKSKKIPLSDNEFIFNESIDAVVGTNYVCRKISGAAFKTGAVFNEDLMLSAPDFRAHEKTLQEIMQAVQMVQPEGVLYIQTWNPKNKFWQFIKNYNFSTFYDHEISQRKELNYPPFSRIILIEIIAPNGMEKLNEKITRAIEVIPTLNVEVLGPVEVMPEMASKKSIYHIVLKSKNRKALHDTTETILKELNKIKKLKIKTDVDPLKI